MAAVVAALVTMGACSGSSDTRVTTSSDPQPLDGTGVLFVASRDGLLSGSGDVVIEDMVRPGRALFGDVSPIAVFDAQRNRLVYNSWDRQSDQPDHEIRPGEVHGRPSIRVQDLDSGEDALLAEGAHTAAVRDDGAVAYVAGVERDVRAGQPFEGAIVVTDDGEDQVWVEGPGEYLVVAWAGSTLLYVEVTEGENLGPLRAADAPGRTRTLANDDGLIAVSPDGRSAIVAGFADDGSHLEVAIVDVGTGERTAELAETGEPLTGLSRGTWTGDRLVAGGSVAGVPGMLLFDITLGARSQLSLTQTWSVPAEIATVSDASFDGNTVTAIGTPPSRSTRGEPIVQPYAFISCELSEQCTTTDLHIGTDQQLALMHVQAGPDGAAR